MSYVHTRQLLRRAHTELDSAHLASSPHDQFIHAHMAALRGAAAALSITRTPARSGRKVRSAWVQLAELGEEWLPWVEYYTASAATRAALESGRIRDFEPAQAEQAAQAAAQFLAAVESHLHRHQSQFAALAHAS